MTKTATQILDQAEDVEAALGTPTTCSLTKGPKHLLVKKLRAGKLAAHTQKNESRPKLLPATRKSNWNKDLNINTKNTDSAKR